MLEAKLLQAENYSFPRFVCVRNLILCRLKQEVGCRVLLTAASAPSCHAYLGCDVAGLEPFGAARIGTKVSSSAKGSLKASQALPLFAHFIIACTPTAVCEWVCVHFLAPELVHLPQLKLVCSFVFLRSSGKYFLLFAIFKLLSPLESTQEMKRHVLVKY